MCNIYLISLSHERSKRFKKCSFITHINAVDTRKDHSKVLSEFGFEDNTQNDKYSRYFNENKGAYGCHLSHYKIWKEISKLPEETWSLILEDDVNIRDLDKVIKRRRINGLIPDLRRYNLVNLNFRGCNGSEAYLIKASAAKRLIQLMENKIQIPVDKFLFSADGPCRTAKDISYSHYKLVGLEGFFANQTTIR